MIHYLARRLLQALLTVLGVTTLIFILLRAIPGDPAGLLFTPGQASTPEALAAIRHEMGLDRPLWRQYVVYLGQVARGDLGHSYQSSTDVRSLVAATAPATFELTAGALVVAVVIGLLAGVVSAIRQYGILDYGTVLLASLGMSAPVFWTGLVLILVFAVNLHWFPAAGRINARNPGGLPDLLRHLVLPSFALGLNGAALLARITRSSMLDVIAKDYVVTARQGARGARGSSASQSPQRALADRHHHRAPGRLPAGRGGAH